MSTVTRTQNEEYWFNRVKDTELHQDLTFLAKIAKATALGTMKESQIVSGIGGIGKTHAYTHALDGHAKPYEYIKAGSVLGLVQELEKCAEKGMVALLDDPKRAMLESEDYQLVLMAATGPEPRLFPYSTMGKRRIYRFTGLQLVILTNIRLDGTSKASDMLKPLVTRMWSCTIGGNHTETFDHACYLAICHSMLRFHGANLQRANLALDYFGENMHLLPDTSSRTLIKIAKLQQQMPECWREAMDRERVKGASRHKPYTGEPPRIILDAVKPKLDPARG